MKFPIDWLVNYVKIPKDLGELTNKLTMIGHLLDKVEVKDKTPIVDLELRGNRADCYSMLGMAREISALYNTPVKLPKWDIKLRKVKSLKKCNLKIESDFVKRVMIVAISDVKIAPSPLWLKKALTDYGIPSINNIVDLTNYVMLESGEPMHAFDLDQIGADVEIRLAKKGEEIITFLGSTLKLTDDDLVWANSKNILSLAGAIGSKGFSITESTTNVLLEAAGYDRANIRRTIHRHNLTTDAGIRHEKELDPHLVEQAIFRYCDLVNHNKWGKVPLEVFDYFPKPPKAGVIDLDLTYASDLAGVKLSKAQAVKILKGLGFDCKGTSPTKIKVICPTFRTDIKCEEDLVEEIVRMYGYDKIEPRILSLEIPPVVTPNYIDQELKFKRDLVSVGFDEVISSSFTREKNASLNQILDPVSAEVIKITNPPSNDFKDLRMNLFTNLLDYTKRIIYEHGEVAMLFEIGKIYYSQKNQYKEKRRLGISFWRTKDNSFSVFKSYLAGFFEKGGLNDLTFEPSFEIPNLKNGYEVLIGKEKVGFGGEKNNIYYLELDLDSLIDKGRPPKTTLWPKYPPQIEDITIKLPDSTLIGQVFNEISQTPYISRVILKDVYQNSYTFRVWFQDKNKTLDDAEVEKIRKSLLRLIQDRFGGTHS